MERTKKTEETLSSQLTRRSKQPVEEKQPDGDFAKGKLSTGSTLLDLAISGTRVRGGGIPGGIFLEAFGPSGSGKTVLLSEIAGSVQRQKGDIMFADPEARINKQFAAMFGFDLKESGYSQPDTVSELFQSARNWVPEGKGKINGIFADSLAALSTNIEMDNDEGDKMGMRRAKEFSEQLRKFCRVIKEKNYIMACSNQIREKANAGMYEEKFTTPGGKAVEFYSSLRLKFSTPEKIKKELTIHGKKVVKIIGVTVLIEVSKSSIDKPYRKAPVTILFDYGIDDIRQNLQYIKDFSKNTVYTCCDEKLDKSLEVSIKMVEENGWEDDLKEQVIHLWESIERKFESPRKAKNR